MTNVRLTWTLPTPTPAQKALSHVRVEGRIAGIDVWTELNVVDVPGTELLLVDMARGPWEFRAFVVDVDGEESTPMMASVVIPFDPPSPLVEFHATLEE